MPAAAAGEHLLHPQPRRRRHEALADRLRRPTKSGGKRPQDKRRRALLRPCRTATAAPRAGRRTALLGRARRCEQDAYSGGHGPARGQRRLRAQSQEKNRGARGGASSAIPPVPPRRPGHDGGSPSRPAPATGRAGRPPCHEGARCGNVICRSSGGDEPSRPTRRQVEATPVTLPDGRLGPSSLTIHARVSGRPQAAVTAATVPLALYSASSRLIEPSGFARPWSILSARGTGVLAQSRSRACSGPAV